MTAVKRLLHVLAPALLLGCAHAAPAPATLDQIKAMIGAASCSAAAQCHSLPLGATPCGGPEAYLPWSDRHTDRTALEALAARHRAERAASHAASGELSDCRLRPDPGATCDIARGACVAGSSALAAVPASAR